MSPKSKTIEEAPVPLCLNSNECQNTAILYINGKHKLNHKTNRTNEILYIKTPTPKQEADQNFQAGSTPTLEEVQGGSSPTIETLQILQADSTQVIKTSEKESEFEESPYRFVIVVVYFLLCFANGMQWVTFSSTADNFRINYELKRIQVDLFSMIYMIIYPFVCVPESYLIDNISVRLGLSLAALFTILGSGLKCLINHHIAWAYIGQILDASFQPAILNSPAKIASVWFKDSHRTLVTSICVTSNTIGILFGFLYHIFFIDGEAIGEQYKTDFYNYVFWEFILVLFFCLPTFFFMYSKPNKPVSNSQLNYQSPPLLESLKLLFKNSSFRFLLGCTTCIVGFTNIYGTILNSYMATYGIKDDHASYSFAAANGCGIIAALVVSSILDKIKRFKRTMLILNISGLFLLVLFTVLLEFVPQTNLFIVLIIMYSLIICCAVPIFSTAMNFVCELTYPVGESISGGWIMSINQISGIVGILISNAFIEYLPQERYLTNLFAIVLFVISIVCIWMIKERLLRNEKENEK